MVSSNMLADEGVDLDEEISRKALSFRVDTLPPPPPTGTSLRVLAVSTLPTLQGRVYKGLGSPFVAWEALQKVHLIERGNG